VRAECGADPGYGGWWEGENRETEEVARPAAGAIHIELSGRATISVESGADSALLRSILESLRK
jgi:hypothetical protein